MLSGDLGAYPHSRDRSLLLIWPLAGCTFGVASGAGKGLTNGTFEPADEIFEPADGVFDPVVILEIAQPVTALTIPVASLHKRACSGCCRNRGNALVAQYQLFNVEMMLLGMNDVKRRCVNNINKYMGSVSKRGRKGRGKFGASMFAFGARVASSIFSFAPKQNYDNR
ncbi:hypothetical protein BX070DRAFT_50836 [Coemansia spiralis]|nr:hypothetical protein BX070DRAFT_50836 [Coemansia spiralis]